MPALADDGWILTRLYQLNTFGYHGNTYTAENTPMPQGYLYEYPLSKLINVLHFVHIRLIIALLLFSLWKYISKNLIILQEFNLVAIPAAIFSAVAPIFLVSLRPEWIISFCVAIYLAHLQKSLKRLNPRSVFWMVLIPIFAISIHQTGIVLIPSAIIATVLQCWRMKKEKLLLETSTYLISALSLGTVVLTFKLNISEIGDSFANFQTAEYYNGTELERAKQFLQFTNPARALLYFLVLAAVTFLTVNLLKSPKSFLFSQRFHLLAILLSVSLTTSKWAWHFGALIVPTVVVLSFWADESFGKRNPRNLINLYTSALFLTALLFFLSKIPAGWGTLDSSGIAWSERYQSLGRYYLTFIILISMMYLGLRFNFKKNHYHAGFKLILLFPLISLVFSSQALFIKDSINTLSSEYEWSPGEQFLRELTFRDECGIFSGVERVSRITPLGNERSNWKGKNPIANIDFNTSSFIKSDSNLSIYRINSNEDFAFDLPKLQITDVWFGIWIKQTGNELVNISVSPIFKNQQGSRPIKNALDFEIRPDSHFQLIKFIVSKSMGSVRVKVTVKDKNEVLLSNLTMIKLVKFSKMESQGKGLKSPFTDVYTPCLRTNYSYYGTLAQPSFALKTFYNFEGSFALQIACRPKPFYCLYAI